MREDQLKSIVSENLDKLMSGCIRGVYPFAFSGSPAPRQEYRVDAAVVNNQLVFSHATQILSFLIMDLNVILLAAQKLFPKLPRNESLKLVVSAHNEILNSASSKLGMILARTQGKNDVIVTPPLIVNQTGENSMLLRSSECLFWNFRADAISFDIIVSIQMV
ncbi:MAG: hypothetical protein ABI036_09785 [Fibrobacteria bacterium]